MAQGMRQRISRRWPNMWGKEVGKEGAACTAGKAILPMLLSMLKPNMPLTWFIVTALHQDGQNLSASKDLDHLCITLYDIACSNTRSGIRTKAAVRNGSAEHGSKCTHNVSGHKQGSAESTPLPR